MRVKWLRKAALNLEDAHDFLSRENPIVAQEFVREVYRLVSLLSTQPAMGRPGRVPGTRELVVQPYPFLLPYRVQGDEIHILRVFHTRQELLSNVVYGVGQAAFLSDSSSTWTPSLNFTLFTTNVSSTNPLSRFHFFCAASSSL